MGDMWDVIEAVFKFAVGFFLGIALGLIIELAFDGSVWLALIMCIVGAIIYWGTLFFHYLLDGILSKLFPSWFYKPRSVQKKDPTSFLQRFGFLIGLAVGVLTAFIAPSAVLDAIL